MSRRSHFTHITPLPPNVSRDGAVAWLHNHREMIELNPLVIRHGKSEPHETAPIDEHECHWYEMTDSINYLPGGMMKGEVTYKGAFHNLPNGLQTHVYAPAGLDLREKWTVHGNMPGEPREPVEMGVKAPRDGLYIREEVDMRCNFLLTGFVKKNLNKAHKVLVTRLVQKAASHGPNIMTDEDRLKNSLENPTGGLDHRPGSAASSSAWQSAHELPTSDSEPAHRELAACQCPDAHLPTCSMYVDRMSIRFTHSSDNPPKALPRLMSERIPYEPFNYVKVTPTSPDNPELFSGNYHPVSHYHLLFGNSDAVASAPPVPQGKLSRIRAELPASPASPTTG